MLVDRYVDKIVYEKATARNIRDLELKDRIGSFIVVKAKIRYSNTDLDSIVWFKSVERPYVRFKIWGESEHRKRGYKRSLFSKASMSLTEEKDFIEIVSKYINIKIESNQDAVIKLLEAQKEKLERDKSDLRNDKRDLVSRSIEKDNEMQKIKEERKIALSRVSNLESEVSDLKDRVDELSKYSVSLEDENFELRKQVEELSQKEELVESERK